MLSGENAPNSGGIKEENPSGDSAEGDEKVFTESQVNKIVRTRLEKERARIYKEVEGRLKDAGVGGLDEVHLLAQRLREKEEILEASARERDNVVRDAGERERRFEHELRRHEDEKREWRGKYETLLKRAELTQAALKAGADPSNVDMIVTFTEGSVRYGETDGFKVVDKDGAAALDPDTGTGMTVERFMRGFLAERPGLVRSAPVRGAGTGALGTKPARYTLEEIRDIAKADPKRYAELKSEGVVQEIYNRHLAEKK